MKHVGSKDCDKSMRGNTGKYDCRDASRCYMVNNGVKSPGSKMSQIKDCEAVSDRTAL